MARGNVSRRGFFRGIVRGPKKRVSALQSGSAARRRQAGNTRMTRAAFIGSAAALALAGVASFQYRSEREKQLAEFFGKKTAFVRPWIKATRSFGLRERHFKGLSQRVCDFIDGHAIDLGALKPDKRGIPGEADVEGVVRALGYNSDLLFLNENAFQERMHGIRQWAKKTSNSIELERRQIVVKILEEAHALPYETRNELDTLLSDIERPSSTP